jgi:hypothetical protein
MDLTRRKIGWEADLIVNYTILSDLSLTVRYGVFDPSSGSAAFYDKTRTFFLASVVYSY